MSQHHLCSHTLIDVCQAHIPSSTSSEVNILLIGSGDVRHVLATLSRARRAHPRRKLHFYIIEPSIELHARQLLALTIALNTPSLLGLQEKAEIFTEIHGNSFVRATTGDYLAARSDQLIKIVCLPASLSFI